jgi:hypothetical protein
LSAGRLLDKIGNDYVTSIELFVVERTVRSCRRSTTRPVTGSADRKEPENGARLKPQPTG